MRLLLAPCLLLLGAPDSSCLLRTTPRMAMATESASTPLPTLADRVNAALALHKSGDADGALVAYQAVVSEVPPALQTSLLSNMGAILNGRGDYTAAAAAFTRAVAAAPENAQAQYNLAVMLTSKLGEHRTALRHCALALRISPTHHKALHLMGNILQELGRPEEAQKFFLKAEEAATEQQEQQPLGAGVAAASTTLDWSHIAAHSRLGDVLSTAMHVEDAVLEMECISERPLIFIVKNILTEDECREIVERAEPLLQISHVMGGDGEAVGSYRSSRNAWLAANDDVLPRLQKRLAALLRVEHQILASKLEELQVVKYDEGGQFQCHHDSSGFQTRIATALLFLNTVDEGSGGETYFPFAPATRLTNDVTFSNKTTSESIQEALARIAQGSPAVGLRVRPLVGSMLIFFNHLLKDGHPLDAAAVHAGLPVARGSTKQIANYWLSV